MEWVVAEAPQSLNPYSYAYNWPLAYPDPYGQCPICVAVVPLIGRKDEIDWAEFRRTVGQETLDRTISDFRNPLNFLPTRKLDRAGDVLKFADKANDARKVTRVSGAELGAARKEFTKAKQQYWRSEATNSAGGYSAEDLVRMRRGKAPIGPDGYPMEIHHRVPLAEGGYARRMA